MTMASTGTATTVRAMPTHYYNATTTTTTTTTAKKSAAAAAAVAAGESGGGVPAAGGSADALRIVRLAQRRGGLGFVTEIG